MCVECSYEPYTIHIGLNHPNIKCQFSSEHIHSCYQHVLTHTHIHTRALALDYYSFLALWSVCACACTHKPIAYSSFTSRSIQSHSFTNNSVGVLLCTRNVLDCISALGLCGSLGAFSPIQYPVRWCLCSCLIFQRAKCLGPERSTGKQSATECLPFHTICRKWTKCVRF